MERMCYTLNNLISGSCLPMGTSPFLFDHSPQLPPIDRIIWIIPMVLIPSAFLIYFFDTHNPIQLAAFWDLSRCSPGGLKGLLGFTRSTIKDRGWIRITDNQELTIKHRDRIENFPLNGLKSVQLKTLLGVMQFEIEKTNGEKVKMDFSGNMNEEELLQFAAALKQANVEWKTL